MKAFLYVNDKEVDEVIIFAASRKEADEEVAEMYPGYYLEDETDIDPDFAKRAGTIRCFVG